MATEIVVALITLGGSAIGAFSGVIISSRLTTYRLEQLEKKVEKHNKVVERITVLERDMKAVNYRIINLEQESK